MTNPLVEQPKDRALTDSAWLLTDVKELIDVQGPWESTVDGVSLALDTIGLLVNPLDAVVSAGVNWLIEHVSYLNDFVDLILGDPRAITAMEKTWYNVATQLEQAAVNFTEETRALPDFWNGPAATSYSSTAEKYVQGLRSSAALAEHIGQGVMAAGIIVATVRGLMLDALVTKLTRWIFEALSAAASAVVTFGGSVASCASWIAADAAMLGLKFASRLEKLAETLTRFAKKLNELKTALEQIDARIDSLSPALKRIRDGARGIDGVVKSATSSMQAQIGKKTTENIIKALDTDPDEDK